MTPTPLTRIRHATPAVAIALTLAATSTSQADPRDAQIRSVDLTTGVLEVFNFGTQDIDLTGWRFCSHDADQVRVYSAPAGLNGVTLEGGTSVFVHFNNDAPAGDPDRLNRSDVGNFALPLSASPYGIQFFRPGSNGGVAFGNSALIADVVQWTVPGQPLGNAAFRTGQAVSEGLWTDVGDFVETNANTRSIVLTQPGDGRSHGPSNYASIGGGDPRDVQIASIDFDAGVLEVTNLGEFAFSLDRWRFCSHDDDQVRVYSAPSGLAGVILEPDTSAFVHFNDDAPANDPDRVNRSQVGNFALPLNQDAYGIQFFRPDSNGNVAFGNSSLIADVVQWTTPGTPLGNAQFRTGQAVSEGLWTNVDDFVPTTADTFLLRLENRRNERLNGPADYRSFIGSFQIEEILVDPVGPNAGAQIVELRNTTGTAYTPNDQWMCIPFEYEQFPALEIPEGGIVSIHIGATGTNTATDWFFSTLSPLDNAESILLFRGSNFRLADRVMDAVSFGGSTERMDLAVQNRQWSFVGDSVTLPSVEGSSIAYTQSGLGADYWYRDASATLGTINAQDVRVLYGNACPISRGAPTLRFATPAVDGNQDFSIGIRNGVAFAPAAVHSGRRIQPTVVFDCELLVDPIAFWVGTLDLEGNVDVFAPIPVDVSTLGVQLASQGYVVDGNAPNATFGATQGVQITVR